MRSRLVPLKSLCVGERCTLNMSRAQTSSRWCVVAVRRVSAQMSSSSLDHGSKTDHLIGTSAHAPQRPMVTSTGMGTGMGSNPGEDMDICKCIVPARHGGTLNSRRAASPLVRLVAGDERVKTCPRGYSQFQRDRSIDRPSIWCTKYGDVGDISRDGLLSKEPMELGPKRRMSGTDSLRSPNMDYCGRKRSPPKRFKESVWRLTGTSSSTFVFLYDHMRKRLQGQPHPKDQENEL
ncbi:hypothetical protein TNCV_3459511 [Trichonephila clavipes]|nr:hypothetical protein TNCV_3459511 [Trichonephila clavipes]